MLLAIVGQTSGALIHAASPSLANVTSAIALAADGDTVIVPAGTASWTSALVITKGITLQGATAVTGDHNSSITVNDRTIILDDVLLTGSPGRAINIDVTLSQNQKFRLTGFTFRYSRTARPMDQAHTRIAGTCPGANGTGSVRIDHCHFDQLNQIGIWFVGWIYGVVDHCRWDVRADVGSLQAMSVNNGATWGGGGGSNRNGDGSWAAPTDFGSEKFIFVEDCLFNNLGTAQAAGKIDGQYGGRFVSRFNQYVNTSVISGHGTESGGRHRGIRAAEFYYNTGTGNASQGWGETRSGTRMYHHNTWAGLNSGSQLPLNVHREVWAFPAWGGATGNNPLDMNDTEGNGTFVQGHAPHLYASGTAASDSTVSGGNGVLTASGSPGWTTNQFVGMMLTNTSQPVGGHPVPCQIMSNTANTITFLTDDGGYGGTPPVVAKRYLAGQSFVVYNPLVALDQIGRGQGDLMVGDPPTTGWLHQALDPVYAFENRTNGSLTNAISNYVTIQENRDYYNQTAAFDGTVGIGVRLLANRPSTCTPGVAYWATDQGEWNSTHDGADGQLYVCTAPNTWTLNYTPYIYPHPLVSGRVPQAMNISTRARVETGDNVLIGGFIVTGSVAKKVIIRAIGPSLSQHGLSDVLADPTLELHDGNGALLQSNDNWQDDPSQASQISASGLAPSNNLESAIIATLQPGNYTAIVRGKNSGQGIALAEVYDLDPAADSQLGNISGRAYVQTNDDVMIGGFIIGNNIGATEVIIRAIGPSLSQHGLSNVLADPTLELHDGNGALLQSNDNWQDDPDQAARISAANLAPSNSLESAIWASLAPGNYTAIVRGKNNGVGIGLVEVYNVP